MAQVNNLGVKSFSPDNSLSRSKRAKNGQRSKLKPIIFLLLGVVVVGFLARRWFFSGKDKADGQPGVKGEEQSAQSRVINLDKQFTFPGFDDQGEEAGEIELKITQVEATDQVIVQDKNYTAKNNKIFLIVNLELKNETTKRLNIFPGDLIRLIVNDQEEKKFAPDLHNNFVLVAPISTKVDRVGFVVDQDYDNLKIQVGQLEGEKEVIKIEFPT